MTKNPNVDFFFEKAKKWQVEMEELRTIVLDCQLTEELKWGVPCYTIRTNPSSKKDANIVLIHGFKEYCALLFFKGALLQDSNKLLIQQTENVQFGRQIRFTNLKEITDLKPILKEYLFEALEVEKAGLKVEFKKDSVLVFPEELEIKFAAFPDFKKAFEALTPGRQKAYNFHFSEAKQSKTREDRIEKYFSRILNGKGLTDCICGHSKRMPSCDGSHKYF